MTKTTDHGFRPGGYEVFDIESLDIGQWTPDPAGRHPPTQVHVEIRIKGLPTPLVMRFKSPDTLGRLIEQLMRHRDEVWPRPASPRSGSGAKKAGHR